MIGTDGLQIELGDTAKYRCSCCDKESRTVHGFLSDSTGQTSVYFAGYTQGHPEKRLNVVLSVGGWGEGTSPSDRRAIPLKVAIVDDRLTFAFPRAEDSPWYGEEFLGEMVESGDLSDEDRLRSEVLARFVIANDPRVARYIKGGSQRNQRIRRAGKN